MPLRYVGMMQLGDLTPPSAVASLWTSVGSWSIVDGERGHEVLCVDQVLDCTPWAKKEPRDSERHQWIIGQGSNTKGPGATHHLVWQTAGQDESNLWYLGEKEATVIGKN